MLLVVSGSLTRKGADQMARKRMTVVRFEEVKRLIGEGLSDRAIMRALRCRREKVAEIRKGTASAPGRPKAIVGPLWTEQVSWAEVTTELSLGHPLKLIHEEKASHLTTYSNFWKQFYRRYPALLKASVTLREFAPGERAEVDGTLVALGDMPWIRSTHVDALIAAFDPAGPQTICVPVHDRKRGHPVLWSARHFAEMRMLGGDVGARALLEKHARAVQTVEVDDAAVHLDIDTPEMLAGARSPDAVEA